MSRRTLLMKYHPAKKEVEFHSYQNGKEIPIRDDSRLMRYMGMRGTFVLQDFGNSFLTDIATTFDGLRYADIQVVTTRLDYEDWEQMVEHYNGLRGEGDCRISTTLLAELPDMEEAFLQVKQYSEHAANILNFYWQRLLEVPSEHEEAQKSAEGFAQQIDDAIHDIRDKIDSLADNNVSLCFTGVYSSGKSALINALLGYRILPEAVQSKTAKMIVIASPPQGEPVQIEFDIDGTMARLEWLEDCSCFVFERGPVENVTREQIQQLLDKTHREGLRQHEQVRRILEGLNNREGISSDVTVKFPVPLDSKSVQFTIYDTPGTDSNSERHAEVLRDALSEQTQSILIFVAHPTKLEGAGNNSLLNYLWQVEKKSSKTTIDIGRSIFVINHADSVKISDREHFQSDAIKSRDDEMLSIQLSDKKLFFTSARYAYASKAIRNGIADDVEEWNFDEGLRMLASERSPYRMCYQQDRCASSEYATGKLLNACERALCEARASDDDVRTLEICSGLYALEREILIYGKKYASAVRTYAIIDSIDRVLADLSEQAKRLLEDNERSIEAINNEIEELRYTLTQAIDDVFHEYELDGMERIEDQRNILRLGSDTKERLGLTKSEIKLRVIDPTIQGIDEALKGGFLFGLGNVPIREADKRKVREIINTSFERFVGGYERKRKELLEDTRDGFLRDVREALEANGHISDDAKRYITDIPKHEIKARSIHGISSMYDSHKRTDQILFFRFEHLDKAAFKNEVEDRLLEESRKMANEFADDYRRSLFTLLGQIKSDFLARLEDYSLDMRAKVKDREAMMELGKRMQEAADELSDRRDELNSIIWKELEPNG